MLQFGPFTLDPRTLELRRGGVPVPLAPQPARLLATLASRPGELVTRDELRRIVWGDDTWVDFERGLNFCVLQARTALGDDAKNPRYIETLPKRGYRFLRWNDTQVQGNTLSEPEGVTCHPEPAKRGEEFPASGAERAGATNRTLLLAATLLTVSLIAGSRTAPASAAALTSTVPGAHDAYLRGRRLWHERATPEVLQSVVALREAIRLDPQFVLPRIALAEALHALAMRDRIAPRAAAAEIRLASDTALRLAPDHAGSHAVAAMSRFWYEWEWDAAERSYREAIRRNPAEAGALHDHAWLLISRGRFDEGIAQIRRAQQLDPVSPRANTHVAWAYIYTRRYDEAVAEARRALALDPQFHEADRCIEHALWLAGKGPLPKMRETDGPDAYSNAVRHLYRGDRDAAMRWLARAKDERNTSFPLAGVDPKLEPLHADARFVALLESAGLTPRTR